MTIKTYLLQKMDKVLCFYLGLEYEEACPIAVKIIKNKLFITHTSSHKRHLIEEPWDKFKIKHTNSTNLEKLGLALGKAIANNLVISFESPSIKKEN